MTQQTTEGKMTSEFAATKYGAGIALLGAFLAALADAGVIGSGMVLTWPVAAIIIAVVFAVAGIIMSYNLGRSNVKVAAEQQKQFAAKDEAQQADTL